MLAVREYIDANSTCPFKKWFDRLNNAAAIKVTAALERIASGHSSAMKAVGEGVSEYRVDFGSGYRIYFGREGDRIIILLGGGTKQRQQQDIEAAKFAWRDYKRRSSQES